MAPAKKNTLQVISSRANTLTARDKVKVSSHMQMVPYMKDFSIKTKSVELGNAPGLMVEFMTGNGSTAKSMGEEPCCM